MTLVLLSVGKLSPLAAGVTVRALDAVWGALTGARNRLIADPTDLVALPFALVARRLRVVIPITPPAAVRRERERRRAGHPRETRCQFADVSATN